MDIIFVPLLRLLISGINLYIMMLIIHVSLSWLEAFNIINRYNRFVYLLQNFLYQITEPLLFPIRRLLPFIGGLDISPIVLILLLHFLQDILFQISIRFAG
ncbi:MAG: YggT family protein [Proteobacteria bacterium]|nr:YggT family protein [Pseudomonadota bacterium]